MALKHFGILVLVFACLLVLPSRSDDSRVSDEERNAGEPKGNVRGAASNPNTRNTNEDKKERNFDRRRNRAERKNEKSFKKKQNKLEAKKEKKYKMKHGNSTTRMGPCSGTGADWSCCSDSSPCQQNQGDCDADSHCAGDLVCGNDNCRDFNPQAHRIADCCIKSQDSCSGTTSDWSCCSSSSPCQENEGDCDNDFECAGTLVCGSDNCKSINPLAHQAADCCIQPDSCSGTTSDWNCCSSSSPCQENEGDCDNNSECAGSLVCGSDNCKSINPLAHQAADCCIQPASCSGTTSDWNCCSSSSPCQENEGDCDTDSECAGSLVCGSDNCRSINPLAHQAADCCIQPGSPTPIPTPTTTPADCKVVAPGPDTGATCIFPFTWSATGKTYNECAFEPSKGDTYAWCSTLVDASGNHVNGGGHWGKCDPDNCPPIAVDGQWSTWSSWSTCTKTCGDATKTRTRTCSNPAPDNGGKPCPGAATQTASCGLPTCGGGTTCKCGIKNKGTRIVGGTESEEFEWPWIARLSVRYESGSYQCGGSLIADQWILTAAHCTDKINGKLPQVIVYLGDHNKRLTDTNEIALQVEKIINHDSYSPSPTLNDIALLKLSAKVDMTKYSPACLPKAASTYVGKMADVYGWGTTSFGGSSSTILQETSVQVITNQACTDQGYGSITEEQICAYTEGKDSCQGDSGGPLTYNDNDKHKQIGVVSYGNGCATVGYSGVYSRVTEYLDWITTETGKYGGATYCDE